MRAPFLFLVLACFSPLVHSSAASRPQLLKALTCIHQSESTSLGMLKASWGWLKNTAKGMPQDQATAIVCNEGAAQTMPQQQALPETQYPEIEPFSPPSQGSSSDVELSARLDEFERRLEQKLKSEVDRAIEATSSSSSSSSSSRPSPSCSAELEVEKKRLAEERQAFEAEKQAWRIQQGCVDAINPSPQLSTSTFAGDLGAATPTPPPALSAQQQALLPPEDRVGPLLAAPSVSSVKVKLDPEDVIKPLPSRRGPGEAAVISLGNAVLRRQEKADVERARGSLGKVESRLRRQEARVMEKEVKDIGRAILAKTRIDGLLKGPSGGARRGKSRLFKPVVAPGAGSGECEVGLWANVAELVTSGQVIALPNHFNPQGDGDGADARSNILDAARGKRVRRSIHGGAPGGSVCLSHGLAKVILHAAISTSEANLPTLTINSVAGGAHHWDADHYNGEAVDFGLDLKADPDRKEKQALALILACKDNGASALSSAIPKDLCEECTKYKDWVHCEMEDDE